MAQEFLFFVFGSVMLLVFWAEVVAVVSALMDRKRKGWRRFVRRWALVVHLVFFTMVGCLFWGFRVEPYWLDVSGVRIETEELGDTRLKVVHFSDMHCDPVERCEDELVEAVNTAGADIVVFTGDMVNLVAADEGYDEAVEILKRTLGAMEARLGKFAVTGNWDKRVYARGLLEGTGFELIDGKTRRVEKDGAEVFLTGIGYGAEPASLRASEDGYNVLLYHKPDLVESVQGFDLYLCGHTHGGQVALPWYGAMVTYSKFGKKYEAGRYEVGEMDVYVGRGVGMEGEGAPRVRFCARPEVAVFEIGAGE